MTSPAASSPRIVAATSAIVEWAHRRGGNARCLLRLRTMRDDESADASTIAVISMLRDNPRGRGVGSDFAGCAHAAATAFLPQSATPCSVRWYAHHGPFSSYDPTGPETLEHVRLRWENQRFLDPAVTDFLLLDPAASAQLAHSLQLEPVTELLERWSWDSRSPSRRPTPG